MFLSVPSGQLNLSRFLSRIYICTSGQLAQETIFFTIVMRCAEYYANDWWAKKSSWLLRVEINTATVWSDFLHNDYSTVVLNVKDDVRIRQKMASASVHRYLASDSIDNTLLRWFELLLGMCSSLFCPTL